jgi:uncharacterized protein
MSGNSRSGAYTFCMNRRRFLKTLGLTGLSAFAATSLVAAKDTLAFTTTRSSMALPHLTSPLKLVQLTDLHYGHFVTADWVGRWVRAVNLEQPDLIVITGDIIDHAIPAVALEAIADLLSLLEARLGVYAVLGNHDYFYRSRDVSVRGLQRRLEARGIRVLVNENQRVRDDLWLSGIDDLWLGEPNLEQTLHGVPSSVASLLLSHNPDILATVPSSVGLTLSGHTHGGQVRVPGFKTLYNVSNYGERFQRGWVTGFKGATGYVSRGLGVGGLPLRMFCPAELVVLELQPA